MILSDVMTEIAEAVGTIDGLRCWDFEPDAIQPPAAVVRWPTRIEYDAAMQRGLDRVAGGLTLCVSRAWDRATRAQLSAYCDGSGDRSIKAALLAWEWVSCSFVRASAATFEPVTVAGIDFMAAQFVLDIAGPGTT